jgi:hypothetical protein
VFHSAVPVNNLEVVFIHIFTSNLQSQCAQKPETRKNLKLFGKVNFTAVL